VVTVPRRLIADAIDLVVFISGRGTGRRLETILASKGLDAAGDYALAPSRPTSPSPKET
jgi:Flp pilus assembly CpaF family ATPase